jgi:hypothetical protein
MPKAAFLNDGSLVRIEIDDFAAFRSALGEDVLSAFCRCFVHADRLTSLMHFTRLVFDHCPHDSVAFTRDAYSMAWFAIGTMREYAKAIQKLRSAFNRAGIFDKESAEWERLIEFESRWERDTAYFKLRDLVAFHVDPNDEIIPRGLDELAKKSPVTLFLSDKPDAPTSAHGHWYRLGMEAIFDGYVPRDDFGRFFTQIPDDLSVSDSLFELFTKTIKRRGTTLVDGRTAAPPAAIKGQ